MDSIILFFIFFLFLILSIPAIIFLIAFLAARSRKKKQQVLLEQTGTPEYYAFVRYNVGDTQNQFFKVKAFQGSGIIYVEDRKIIFKDTLNQNPYTFILDESSIKWEDVNIVNGLLKWFSISDNTKKYFFNIDSGMFIFNTNSSKPTTKSVFDKLIQYQTGL
ncbi:hypothetical protein [Chryseobacterium indoltheticum]|uniref:YokE-like PH domain-containing protein n=1 Tax=Chryseobacterium indoltheticum TaxID=254 RepID=A0A381F7V7_9FLAO|nr:hypothetical protein [Chryseobacterium indoltheticum]AZA72941.1 hypothetical protein EG358_03825 [Chryseobacterium indoltheticum]SIP89712.1 hypothetical protein SAMN05421682_101241 [Chryseobacterium indoltheticum]SUX42548.1 Uncharacterised protein [Chryseobacterium indoltheticum]